MPASIVSIGFVVIVLCVIVYSGTKRRAARQVQTHGRRKPPLRNKRPPVNAGLRENIPLVAVSTRMEEAFSTFFGDAFKERVLFKHPGMKSADYDWTLFELKRYFLMCSLLKEVPMFSEEVDEIWHEMLLYSREYQQFCEAFARRIIHHSPHTSPLPMPNERAFFDWVYCQLFEVTPFSTYVWKGFFQHPLSPEQLHLFETETTVQLAQTLFQPIDKEQDPGREQTVRILILKMKEQIRHAKSEGFEKSSLHNVQHQLVITNALVFYSLFGRDDYNKKMSILLNKYSHTPSGSSNDAGCSFDFSGSYHGGHSHHGGEGHGGHGGHGGGHGSCSGHSGCGGSSGCGSGCGGGGH